MSEFVTKYNSKKVQIILQENIINKSWSFLDKTKRYVIITDTNIMKKYGEIISSVPNLITCLTLIPGELAKTVKVYKKIIDELLENSVNENDIIISFGGGVISDITGFVASTFKCGVSFIQIPTTLVAQADTLTGNVNLNVLEKNEIGTIYHPEQIIIDPILLKTLPKEEISHGVSTLLKNGLIKDQSIVNDLQKFPLPFNPSLLNSFLERSIKLKIQAYTNEEINECSKKIFNFSDDLCFKIQNKSKDKIKYGEALFLSIYYQLKETELEPLLLELNTKYSLTSNIDKYASLLEKEIEII